MEYHSHQTSVEMNTVKESAYSESSFQAFNFFRGAVLQHAPPRPEVRVNTCKDRFHIT